MRCCWLFRWSFSLYLKAEEEPVILRPEIISERGADKRSIQFDGMRVFAGMPDSLGDTEYSLEIPGNGAGAYTLWVLVDETMYVGEFEVE